jgi:hypothetical protein
MYIIAVIDHKGVCVHIWLSFLVLISGSVLANDKDQYHLFNPTPQKEMRGLNTDRPDKTESPYTVDAGHFQFETDFINYTYNRDRVNGETVTSETTYFNFINLKAGLTNSMDIQVLSEMYVESKVRTQNLTSTQRGYGDTYIRLKKNLYGNDSGDFAMGIMPYVKLPTAAAGMSNDRLEGGLLLPFAFSLPHDWSMGTMLQVGHSRNEADTGSQTDYAMTMTAGHSIIGDLSGLIEVYSAFTDKKNAEAVATLDLGVTYLLTPQIQLDAGYFVGLTDAADDYTTFAGLSVLY